MKPLALLPLTLLSASCFYPAEPPPPRQRPPYYREGAPYRESAPYSPYGPGSESSGTESGTFEPVPEGNRPPPPPDTRPRITEDPIDPDSDSPPPAATPRPTYPTAKPSSTPGRVISPYAPYNVIDVEGFKSGELVKDPSNKKIFRVP